MRLGDFRGGGRISIDANVLVYHLDASSPYQPICSEFLRRIEPQQVHAVTSTLVVDEVIYAILIHEGSPRLKTPRLAAIQKRILTSPEFAKQCYAAVGQVLDYLVLDYLEVLRLHGLSIFEATFDIVKASLPLAVQHQLLPRDAIHASTCQALGIAHIATRDDHFTRLPFLRVWMP